jgi:hypothetical protein
MNLQKLLTQLNTKLTDAEIGKQIGASQSIVTRLRNGTHKRTFHERGEAIKKLAAKHGVLNNQADC